MRAGGYRLRAPGDRRERETLRSVRNEEHERAGPNDEDEQVLCRQCLNVITGVAERIERQGAHEHCFANPDGILFHLGCFGNAPGCGSIGEATEEWSWFRGYAWQAVLCRQCLTHVGWMYLATSATERFYGLILGHLIFPHGWN